MNLEELNIISESTTMCNNWKKPVYFQANEKQSFDEWRGNRIATVLYYVSA